MFTVHFSGYSQAMDSMGIQDCIPVSKTKFFQIVRQSFTDMENLTNDTARIIDIVKVYNTLDILGVIRTSSDSCTIKNYKTYFEKKYLPTISRNLDLIISKGLGHYSVKLDIYIGISTTARCRDVFWIDGNEK